MPALISRRQTARSSGAAVVYQRISSGCVCFPDCPESRCRSGVSADFIRLDLFVPCKLSRGHSFLVVSLAEVIYPLSFINARLSVDVCVPRVLLSRAFAVRIGPLKSKSCCPATRAAIRL